ncbi:SPRY domain-containing SOCS box protein 3 [Caerostris darwini]|uniref:SPRY domain-containing SOCS box protein 3 n=1 Tax=Caerostris darwini TaxID=1538125 RepID=A0AAV4PFK8_9ARAC|nr:SPRY domain-containing SOCS box protein 3 [Caerostris darwini]
MDPNKVSKDDGIAKIDLQHTKTDDADMMLSPRQLSECGLFYIDNEDIVKFFYCGGSLGNRELNDNPWVEHEKYFPDCRYLNLVTCHRNPEQNSTHHNLEEEKLFLDYKDRDPAKSNYEIQSSENSDWTYEILKRLNERTDEDIITTTAVIKGTQPMINDQFFWEVEIIYPSNDTDMTVGIGTVDFDLHPLDYQLIAILAKDGETWSILNIGTFYSYGSWFMQGSVIGVHLDVWNGTLSFYRNKKYLGIACRGLKGKVFYSMACSTLGHNEM